MLLPFALADKPYPGLSGVITLKFSSSNRGSFSNPNTLDP